MNALPTGGEQTWTPLDKRRIMFLAWHIMHELAHAIGSVLANAEVIPYHRTPKKFTAFEAELEFYKSKCMLPNGLMKFYGERGWWIEDKMGGHMRVKDDVHSLFSLSGSFQLSLMLCLDIIRITLCSCGDQKRRVQTSNGLLFRRRLLMSLWLVIEDSTVSYHWL